MLWKLLQLAMFVAMRVKLKKMARRGSPWLWPGKYLPDCSRRERTSCMRPPAHWNGKLALKWQILYSLVSSTLHNNDENLPISISVFWHFHNKACILMFLHHTHPINLAAVCLGFPPVVKSEQLCFLLVSRCYSGAILVRFRWVKAGQREEHLSPLAAQARSLTGHSGVCCAQSSLFLGHSSVLAPFPTPSEWLRLLCSGALGSYQWQLLGHNGVRLGRVDVTASTRFRK